MYFQEFVGQKKTGLVKQTLIAAMQMSIPKRMNNGQNEQSFILIPIFNTNTKTEQNGRGQTRIFILIIDQRACKNNNWKS